MRDLIPVHYWYLLQLQLFSITSIPATNRIQLCNFSMTNKLTISLAFIRIIEIKTIANNTAYMPSLLNLHEANYPFFSFKQIHRLEERLINLIHFSFSFHFLIFQHSFFSCLEYGVLSYVVKFSFL
jgi:hypothetical protein